VVARGVLADSVDAKRTIRRADMVVLAAATDGPDCGRAFDVAPYD